MELLNRFRDADREGLPGFENYDKPLEMSLWVLWVAKDKLNRRSLTVHEIVDVLVGVMEVSVKERAIVNSLNRAGAKIHAHSEGGQIHHEIMKAGKEHLLASVGRGSLEVYYFEPGRKYSSKKVLTEKILDELKGGLKVVDPYCDSGTLDILSKAKSEKIEFLTRIDNLRENVKQRFLKDLVDFKAEYANVEFRSYSKSEIHDRYIISGEKLVILGYSLKDLGGKKSFAIVLDKKTSGDVFDALTQNFERRWKAALPL